jgi:hypothetical membrane protein
MHTTATTATSAGHTLPSRRRRQSGTELLLACGAAAALLFVLTFTVDGALRAGYDPVRHYVSQLSLGPGGWVQVANFLVTGVLMVLFSLGMRRRLHPGRGSVAGPVLLGLVGAGLATAGIFSADPGLNGFPPGSSLPPGSPTAGFVVHILAAAVVFFSLPAACAAVAFRSRRDHASRAWVLYTSASGALVWALWAASTVLSGDGTAPIDPYIGAVQRIYLLIGFTWIAAHSLRERAAERSRRTCLDAIAPPASSVVGARTDAVRVRGVHVGRG